MSLDIFPVQNQFRVLQPRDQLSPPDNDPLSDIENIAPKTSLIYVGDNKVEVVRKILSETVSFVVRCCTGT